jgi:hypothetical protein
MASAAALAGGLIAGLVATASMALGLAVPMPIAAAVGLSSAAAVWFAIAQLVSKRVIGRDTEQRTTATAAVRRQVEALRQEAFGQDDAATDAATEASSLPNVRQEFEDLSRQDDGGTRPSVESRAREIGERLPEALRMVTAEENRLGQLRTGRDRLVQERMIAVSAAESARLRAETMRSEYERSLEAAGGDCSAEAIESGRARVADAERSLERARGESAAELVNILDIAGMEQRLRVVEEGIESAEQNLDRTRKHRDAVVGLVAQARARFELAEEVRLARPIAQIRARLERAQAGGGQAVTCSAEVANAEYDQCRDRLTECGTNVRAKEQALATAREKAERTVAASNLPIDLAGAEREMEEAIVALDAIEAESVAQSEAIRATEEEAMLAADGAQAANRRLEAAKAAAGEATWKLSVAREDVQGSSDDQARRELEQALESVGQDLLSCERDLNEARGRLHLISRDVDEDKLEQQRDAVERAREYADEQKLQYESAKLLHERLQEAESKRASHLGNALAVPVTAMFRELTAGRYPNVTFDPDLSAEAVMAVGEPRAVDTLSVGTREQLATLVRLAIAAHLKTAVVLDDQLVHSDTGRLAWFRERLRTSVRVHAHQVIVFSCRVEDYLGPGVITDDASLTLVDLGSVIPR